MDQATLKALAIKHGLSTSFTTNLVRFYESYCQAGVTNGYSETECQATFGQFVKLVLEELSHPYTFEPYHPCIRTPFDYYQFGLDFIRLLINFKKSTLLGTPNVERIQAQLAKGENVILFANHQTEPDPQVISLMLEKDYGKLAVEMIFVAGHRVVTDPMAIPFSKGRHLICIYSKRHISYPPEQKEIKLQHNRLAMHQMGKLLGEGGKCIYVAPSGGRDRMNENGIVEVAPFDPQSIEMFWLVSRQAGILTHFYPLALSTYALLPPPCKVEKEIGEQRLAHCEPVHLSFGKEIDMENIPGVDGQVSSVSKVSKQERRLLRSDWIWKLVCEDYRRISL